MDKYRSHQRDEESPAINGPDYVALVIEWEEPVQPVENAAGSGASVAPRSSNTDLSDDDNPIWSRVDEASAESFPASDPPAWGSSHAVASAGVPDDIPEEVTMRFAARARARSTHRLAFGIAAFAALFTMFRGLRHIRRHA
jgi:hypothetical protein